MVKRRRDRPQPGRMSRNLVDRRALALLIALAAGVGLLGIAAAQTGTPPTISLNSPVSFPVDI